MRADAIKAAAQAMHKLMQEQARAIALEFDCEAGESEDELEVSAGWVAEEIAEGFDREF